MGTETADVIGHDVTTITCVCGNTVSKDGLIQANSQGVPVHNGDNTPVPAGLAAWPADEDLHTLCPCLRPRVPGRGHRGDRDRAGRIPGGHSRGPDCRGHPRPLEPQHLGLTL